MSPLGLQLGEREVGAAGVVQTLVKVGPVADPYPRRPGTTRKRPLW
jgi:hypothetical protein